MKQYLDALDTIMKDGIDREGRNGWTRSRFAIQMRFDLTQGFPAVTTKKLAFKSVLSELIWFIEGSRDERRLAEILHGTSKATSGAYMAYSGETGRMQRVRSLTS